MKWIALFFFTLMMSLCKAQDLLQTGYRAEAFFAAHDYQSAYQIYQTLLQIPLPPWQQVRIQYNLGTIYLAQQQWSEALWQFRTLSMDAITSPQLLFNLAVNLSLAQLRQAESLATQSSLHALDEAIYLLERAIKDLQQAQSAMCDIQQAEMGKNRCSSSRQLTLLKEACILRLQQIREKQRQTLLEQAPLFAKINLITGGLIQGALTFTYKIDALVLQIQLLLASEALSIESLQAVLKQLEELDTANPKVIYLRQAIEVLQKSITKLKSGHSQIARLFLIASSLLLQDKETAPPSLNTPVEILQAALQKEREALQLSRLADLEDLTNEKSQKEIFQWIAQFQRQALEKSLPFIPSVLATQQEHFQGQSSSVSRCQRKPWDQAIPLFERGQQGAKRAEELLSKSSHSLSAPLFEQEQSVADWQQALDLLKNPPAEEEKQSLSSQQAVSTNEVFQRLEEMEAEDQPEKPAPKELNAW